MRVSAGVGKVGVAALASLDSLNERYGLISSETLLSVAPVLSAKVAPGSPRSNWESASRLSRWHRLAVASRTDPQTIADDYEALASVEVAQPNYLIPIAASPDDPLFAAQWNLEDLGYSPGSEIGYDRDDRATVLVGLVDSGLDYTHPDIVDHIWTNSAELNGRDDVDDDGNGYVDDIIGWDFADAPTLPGEGDYVDADADPMDESGHGTHVGGIIAAGVNNGIGIAGVSSGAQLMVLRAAVSVGGASFLENDAIAAAIIYAVDNGAQILNFSFGSPQLSPLIRDAVRYAADAGVVLVAAVGNEGDEHVFYPARHRECIAVAASDINGRIMAFSNHGSSVDVAAPGDRIHSLAPGGQYTALSGTSMSAGHVTGLAAVWLSHFPHLTALQIRGAIAASSRDVEPAGWDARSGAGIARVPDQFVQVPLAVQLSIDANSTSAQRELEVHLTGRERITYAVDWASGPEAASWSPLGRGVVDIEIAGSRIVELVTWGTEGLTDGDYIVRVVAEAARSRHEDYLEVSLQRNPVDVVQLDWFRELAGPVWQYIVGWRTSRPSAAFVRLFENGESEPAYELAIATAAPATEQSVVLPSDLTAGRYTVDVGFAPVRSTTSGDRLAIEVGPRGIVQWQLDLLGLLPDGFLMPGLSDFDNDQRPEIVQMVAGGGGSYNTASFFEADIGSESGFTAVHTSARAFIPWSQHDLDKDGKLELMAVDAERVRILESDEAGQFPSNVVWERRDVWGGEVADLDNDGQSEIFLRSSRAAQFRVFESVGDNEFAEAAVLVHPLAESGEFGDRQVVGDLDGDGWGEILTGDDNGNLVLFESVGDNAFRHVWSDAGGNEGFQRGDRRVLGGGADLDGDGRVEFVSCEFLPDLFEFDQNRWRIQVFESTDNNEFEVEWSAIVNGGKALGNGVAMGDVDGDGQVEFVLALVPDLYVLGSREGEYDPLWHSFLEDVRRPLVADLNGDGANELGFNSDGSIRVFSVAAGLTAAATAPGRVAGVPLDESSAIIEWEPVAGAIAYRVYRRHDGEETLLAELGANVINFTDRLLIENDRYRYIVVAVDSAGVEGYRSPPVVVEPEPAPSLLKVERISPRQVSLLFDRQMGHMTEDPYRYRIEPAVGAPSSAVRDRDALRIVLGFPQALPDSGTFSLRLQGLGSIRGTPLPVSEATREFELLPPVRAVALVGAEAFSEIRVIVRFDGPVEVDPQSAAFAVDEGRIRIVAVTRGSSANEVALQLDGETPLRRIGRRYALDVAGLLDAAGQVVAGRTFIQMESRGLGDVIVYPNPLDLSKSAGVTFAHLPAHTSVLIINLAGELVRSLEETDGDGGVLWDGLNESGQRAGSGIYVYQLASGDDIRTGKFAIVGGR